MIEAIRSIFTTNLGVRPDEKVLVFTDRPLPAEAIEASDLCRRERLMDVALLVAEVGASYAKKVIFREYPANMSHGAEPPPEIWEAAFGSRAVAALSAGRLMGPLLAKKATAREMERAEAAVRRYCRSAVRAVVALSNYSTSHTRFRDLLTRVCGARYASMPLFDAAMFEGAMSVDWKALARRTTAVARLVNRAAALEVTTPNGTRLFFSKKGRAAMSDTGVLTRPGSFGNLPAGEVYLAPLEGTAEGELMLEWAPTRELASRVRITVREGRAVAVEGEEPYARVLRAKIAEREGNENIAELGIGTNDRARRPDNILESEKILGTVHVALGDNSSFGGTVKTPFHQDFVFFRPTVRLIGRDGGRTVLMEQGRFLQEG